jgi:hypothetical protein
MTKEVTYLFKDTEVRPTGRIAVKRSPKDPKKVIDKMIEVEPIDTMGPTWKSWARTSELFVILNDEGEKQ